MIEELLTPFFCVSHMFILNTCIHVILLLQSISLIPLDSLLILQILLILTLHSLFCLLLLHGFHLSFFLCSQYVITESLSFHFLLHPLLFLHSLLIGRRCMHTCLSHLLDHCLFLFLSHRFLLILLVQKVKHLSLNLLIFLSLGMCLMLLKDQLRI